MKIFVKSMRLPHLCVALLLLVLASCTGSRRLPEGQLLYRGAKIAVKKSDKKWPTDDLKTAAGEVISVPVRNKTILGISIGLWVSTHFKEQTWVYKKFAAKPVLYTTDMAPTTEKLLHNRAFNHGYFESEVKSNVKINPKKRTVKVKYTLTVLAPPHRLHNIDYPPVTDDLTRRVVEAKSNSLLKTNALYKLDELRADRDRIATRLRDDGYHQFNADYLFFEADTTVGNRRIDLDLKVKPSAPANAFVRYKIDSVVVFPNLFSISDTTYRTLLSSEGACVEFRGLPGGLPHEMLRKTLCFKCGDYYSGAAHEATLAYLFHLNAFKFVNVRFEPHADSTLAVDIRLIPYKRNKIKLYGSAVFSPQLYWGADFGFKYDNRNVFGGAELLNLEASAQPVRVPADNSDDPDINILTMDAKATLTIPQLRPPKYKPDGSIYAPLLQNKITAEYKISRYTLFDNSDIGKYGVNLHEIDATGGRILKNSNRATITQEFNPISVGGRFTTVFPGAFKDDFTSIVQADTTSNITYAPQIYFEPNYTFTWDNRFKTNRRHQTFLRLKTTLRGGAFLDSPYTPPSLKSKKNFVTFFESDFRKFFKLRNKSMLAGKIVFNAALPLNEASTNTFSLNDLYIIGGANSVRAFAPRTIGPGSVSPDATSEVLAIADHVGNILLETSIEYRKRWSTNWEWAAFIDAGNVWTYAALPDLAGAEFKFNRFYKEFAVGAGLGLRYGISFLVIRLDLAMPIVKPWLPEGERWVLGAIRPFSPEWRKENLVLNFSVGYPF